MIAEKYPSISLRHKIDRLQIALDIKKQKFLFTEEFANKRKKMILMELKKFLLQLITLQ